MISFRLMSPRQILAPLLFIPGWGGSGPEHWQSHWERELGGATRVEMPDWDTPRRADWVGAIDKAVRSSTQPPILVAHSLGCMAVAHWAAHSSGPVRGALLVAPADLDRESLPPLLREFGPVPRTTLRFPSHVVASDDDPYAALPRVREIARDWGSQLTVLSGAGHINAASGHGPWPVGRALLDAFRDEAHER